MQVVIFDIECSCEDRKLSNSYPMETIEIGAVKVENGKVIDEFQAFVKPEYVDKLTPFCMDLTKITFEDLKNAPSFTEAILDFYEFFNGCNIYSCGDFDRKFLTRELKEKGTENSHLMVRNAIQSSHRNLKTHFSVVTKNPPAGMTRMAKEVKVDLKGTHHRGIDDARNLAQIFIKLEETRENLFKENFTSEELEDLILKISNEHNEKDLHGKIDFNNIRYFFDEWESVILVDHKERKLDYLEVNKLAVIERFSNIS